MQCDRQGVFHVRDFDEQLLVAVARQHIDAGGSGGLLTSPAQHGLERLRVPGVEALRLPEVDELPQVDLQPPVSIQKRKRNEIKLGQRTSCGVPPGAGLALPLVVAGVLDEARATAADS